MRKAALSDSFDSVTVDLHRKSQSSHSLVTPATDTVLQAWLHSVQWDGDGLGGSTLNFKSQEASPHQVSEQ